MGGQGIYVGVDVAKERLDIALRPSGESFAEANDKPPVSRLVKRLKVLDFSQPPHRLGHLPPALRRLRVLALPGVA